MLAIPEVAALDAPRAVVRIPPELNVPLTPRVRRVIDTPEFRRLARISQLGLVSLVYPGATHSRFEHALGSYYLALRYLRHLAQQERFASAVDRHAAETLVVAALLHDLGHWPFCHPIEDMALPGFPHHEAFAAEFLAADGELGRCLRHDWGVKAAEVLALLGGTEREPQDERRESRVESTRRAGDSRLSSFDSRLLRSILSGPIDVDKMDYLARDSLHAGVPYGRNFDQGRLISSVVVNGRGDGLALTEKGKTAAELIVFARYVMFSEVYWHHAVRAATAMFARAFYELYTADPPFGGCGLGELFRQDEPGMVAMLRRAAGGEPGLRPRGTRPNAPFGRGGAAALLDGIFGARRELYKRLATYGRFQEPELYGQIARRPYAWLVRCADELAGRLGALAGTEVRPGDVLIDAPPVHLEVQFDVEIYFAKEGAYRALEEVSPVIHALGREQFDDYVKRVRIFCHPGLIGKVTARLGAPAEKRLVPLLCDAIDAAGA